MHFNNSYLYHDYTLLRRKWQTLTSYRTLSKLLLSVHNVAQGAPTTCNRLTYQEVCQQTYVQTLLASLGVVIGQNSALSLGKAVKKWGGGGGGDNKKLGGDRGFWQIAHSSYSRHQILSDTLHCLFPRSTFLPRTYFFQISQPAKIGL